MYKSYITLSFASIGRVLSSVWPWWFSSSPRQHLLREAQSPWWRTGEFWFTQFSWHNLTGEGQKGRDREAADEATIPLVKMVTLGSEEVESGQTSLPVLDSAITTSSMAYQLRQQHQGMDSKNNFDSKVFWIALKTLLQGAMYRPLLPQQVTPLQRVVWHQVEKGMRTFLFEIFSSFSPPDRTYYGSCYIINCIYCDLIYHSSSNMSCLCSFYLLDILSYCHIVILSYWILSLEINF